MESSVGAAAAVAFFAPSRAARSAATALGFSEILRTLRCGLGASSASAAAATRRVANAATRRADGIIAPVTRITQSTRLLFDIDTPRVDAPASEADARRHCIAETVVTGARGAVTACIILSRQRARVWCGPDVGKSFC